MVTVEEFRGLQTIRGRTAGRRRSRWPNERRAARFLPPSRDVAEGRRRRRRRRRSHVAEARSLLLSGRVPPLRWLLRARTTAGAGAGGDADDGPAQNEGFLCVEEARRPFSILFRKKNPKLFTPLEENKFGLSGPALVSPGIHIYHPVSGFSPDVFSLPPSVF